METLTTENIAETMEIQSKEYRELWSVVRVLDRRAIIKSRDTGDVVYLGAGDYGLWEIRSRPPLVAFGPKSTDDLGIVPQAATSDDLDGFRPLVDEMMDRMNALAGAFGLSGSEDFDSVTGILLMMMHRLDGPQAASSGVLKALSGLVDKATRLVEIIQDAKGGAEDLAWTKALAGQALPFLRQSQQILLPKAVTRKVDGAYEKVEELLGMMEDAGGFLADNPRPLAICRAMVPKFSELLAMLNPKDGPSEHTQQLLCNVDGVISRLEILREDCEMLPKYGKLVNEALNFQYEIRGMLDPEGEIATKENEDAI